MLNESLVTASASVIFIVITFRYCKYAIDSIIENRINLITTKYNDALSIKRDSETLLKEQQEFYKTSQTKVDEILLSAKKEIDQLKTKAELDLESQLKSKTLNAQNKIQDQEQKSVAELRLKAFKIATSSSIDILKSHNKITSLIKLNTETLDIMSHQL